MTQFIMEAIVLCEVGGGIGFCWHFGGNAASYFSETAAGHSLD
jgi:hypothetical protein